MDSSRKNRDLRVFAAPRGIFAVALVAVAVFGYVQAEPALRDADSFYHAAMAEEMFSAPGAFPWLPHTVIADGGFFDHQFLYHATLVPFVAVFGGPGGVKTASLVFAVLTVMALYDVIRRLGGRYPAVIALVAVCTASFAFRINLGKASAVSLLLLLYGIEAVVRHRRRRAAVLSWLFVWTHAAWPLMPGVAACAVVAAAVRRRDVRDALRTSAAVLGGIAAGIVINPWFPANLGFYREQIVQVALLGHPVVVAAGTEWAPPGPERFLFLALPAVIALVLGVAAYVYGARARGEERSVGPVPQAFFTTLFMATALLLMTLRQERHVEFFVPVALLCGAIGLSAIDVRSAFRVMLGKRPYVAATSMGVVAFAFMLAAVSGTMRVRAAYLDGIPYGRFQAAGTWLASNASADTTVMHGAWDDFPMLMYRCRSCRFVNGLDPLFLYRADPELYGAWASLEDPSGMPPSSVMTSGFASDILLVTADEPALRRKAEDDPALSIAYEDADAAVFMRNP